MRIFEDQKQVEQYTSGGSEDDDTDDNEGYLLRPKGDIHLQTEPIHQNIKSFCNRIHLRMN